MQIVWQDLVDFAPVTCGRMYIEVVTTGISAMRGPGNASPLAGEEILVKRLADTLSQAVEKGLAVKVVAKKAEVAVATLKRPAMTAVVTPTIVASIPLSTLDDMPSSSSDSSGPRNAGARRSSERTRGSRRSSSTNSDGE